VGALDDPFLQDFLQQPYGNWNPDSYQPVSGIPSAQLQFDWENANLFGTNGHQWHISWLPIEVLECSVLCLSGETSQRVMRWLPYLTPKLLLTVANALVCLIRLLVLPSNLRLSLALGQRRWIRDINNVCRATFQRNIGPIPATWRVRPGVSIIKKRFHSTFSDSLTPLEHTYVDGLITILRGSLWNCVSSHISYSWWSFRILIIHLTICICNFYREMCYLFHDPDSMGCVTK
jgi:hypothetical protein